MISGEMPPDFFSDLFQNRTATDASFPCGLCSVVISSAAAKEPQHSVRFSNPWENPDFFFQSLETP
jgi:hypothetical protein